jgi:hypothetical protein
VKEIHPQRFLSQTIELAGDELTEPQIAEAFSRVVGHPVQVTAPEEKAGASPEQVAMQRFFKAKGYDADIAALRRIYPGLHTFEQWLRQNGWENAQPEPLPQSESR